MLVLAGGCPREGGVPARRLNNFSQDGRSREPSDAHQDLRACSALRTFLERPRSLDDRRHDPPADGTLHADRRRLGEMECRGDFPFRQGLRSQSSQHACWDGLDVLSQPPLAQSRCVGAGASNRRQREGHRLLCHLCCRARGQHCLVGTRYRIFLADRHGRRADLSLCFISAFLGGFSDLQLVFACSLLRTCDGGIECRDGIHPDVRSCPRLAIQPHAWGQASSRCSFLDSCRRHSPSFLPCLPML
jgi:hypothetical protein